MDSHSDATLSFRSIIHDPENCSHPENLNNLQQRLSQVDRVRNALAILRSGKISLLDFLSKVLGPSENEFKAYRTAMYFVSNDGPPKKLYNLFDLILTDSRSGPLFRDWIGVQAVEIVSSKIYDEMDKVKDTLRGTIDSITPEFLTT